MAGTGGLWVQSRSPKSTQWWTVGTGWMIEHHSLPCRWRAMNDTGGSAQDEAELPNLSMMVASSHGVWWKRCTRTRRFDWLSPLLYKWYSGIIQKITDSFTCCSQMEWLIPAFSATPEPHSAAENVLTESFCRLCIAQYGANLPWFSRQLLTLDGVVVRSNSIGHLVMTTVNVLHVRERVHVRWSRQCYSHRHHNDTVERQMHSAKFSLSLFQ